MRGDLSGTCCVGGNVGVKQEQINLMNELKIAIEPIIKKYIEEETLDTADVVYCSMLEAEEIALQTKRAMRKRLEGNKVK